MRPYVRGCLRWATGLPLKSRPNEGPSTKCFLVVVFMQTPKTESEVQVPHALDQSKRSRAPLHSSCSKRCRVECRMFHLNKFSVSCMGCNRDHHIAPILDCRNLHHGGLASVAPWTEPDGALAAKSCSVNFRAVLQLAPAPRPPPQYLPSTFPSFAPLSP